MAEAEHLAWFRSLLVRSLAVEPQDPAPVLAWLEAKRARIVFDAELIPLSQVRRWAPDQQGNVRHDSGQFFAVEGARIRTGGDLREVREWDQPIFTQPEGGILGMVAREVSGAGVQLLLQAKAEPGNLGKLQLVPSLQCTWSNIRRAHQGGSPPLTELLAAEDGVRWIYRAMHNEEGGRFWRKSNENLILFLNDERLITTDLAMFYWASLSQIKRLALLDNVLSPFVKTIIAPL
jgi:oxidase EvaA